MPLIIHSKVIEKCHQRARPIECRMPGMPSHDGIVTESSFAVQTRPVGTAFWKRNHSVPGVQSRVQYSRGWSARICTPARMMKAMKKKFRKCSNLSQPGKPVVTATDGGIHG